MSTQYRLRFGLHVERVREAIKGVANCLTHAIRGMENEPCDYPTETLDPLLGVTSCPQCGQTVLAGAKHAVGEYQPPDIDAPF